MLVATLEVRNASISRPVGISNVRITESREEVTSHRESGEKVCVKYEHQHNFLLFRYLRCQELAHGIPLTL